MGRHISGTGSQVAILSPEVPISGTGSPAEMELTPYSTSTLGPGPWEKEKHTPGDQLPHLPKSRQDTDEYQMNDGYTTEDSTAAPNSSDEQILDEELYEPVTVPFEESCEFWDEIPLAHIVTTYANTTCHYQKVVCAVSKN